MTTHTPKKKERHLHEVKPSFFLASSYEHVPQVNKNSNCKSTIVIEIKEVYK